MISAGRPDFETVIGGLYQAAAISDLWPTALQSLADLMDSRGALITRPDRLHDGLMHSPDLRDTVAQFFDQNWHQNDLRTERIVERYREGFMRDQDILAPEEMARSDYYAGFARAAGVPWFAASGIAEPDGVLLGISIQRSAADGAFDDDDMIRLRRLTPHLEAVLRFSRHVAEAHQADRLSGLERIDVAACALDRQGVLRGLNSLGERMMPGVAAVRQRRLVAHDPAVRAALDRMVAAACATPGSHDGAGLTAVRARRRDGGTVLIQAVPVAGAGHDLFAGGQVIVTFTPIGQAVGIDPVTLGHAFGLTLAESQVARLLCDGLDVPEIAARLEVSAGAVRFHLKSILPKAGVTRQAAFVAAAAALRRMV